MLTEQRRPCGDLHLNAALSSGDGPSLVLLHGVTRRWQDFLTLLPVLLPRWRVHVLDLRGHGHSDRGVSYLVVDYVRDVAAYLRTYLDTPAVVYGHSLGALVAAAVAAQLPEHVRAVVLEDPPAPDLVRDLPRRSFHALFAGMQPLAGDPRPVSEVARDLAAIPLGTQSGTPVRLGDLRDATATRFGARCLREVDPALLSPLLAGQWLDGYDVGAVTRGVRCPALLLRADPKAGGMLPASDAAEFTASMPDCTTIDLPGVGHLVHWLAPADTARYVVGFLESL